MVKRLKKRQEFDNDVWDIINGVDSCGKALTKYNDFIKSQTILKNTRKIKFSDFLIKKLFREFCATDIKAESFVEYQEMLEQHLDNFRRWWNNTNIGYRTNLAETEILLTYSKIKKLKEAFKRCNPDMARADELLMLIVTMTRLHFDCENYVKELKKLTDNFKSSKMLALPFWQEQIYLRSEIKIDGKFLRELRKEEAD